MLASGPVKGEVHNPDLHSILEAAHELLAQCRGGRRPVYVTYERGNWYVRPFGSNADYFPTLRVDWDPPYGWVFQEMP